MNILSRLMARFGYVRLKEYGYELSPSGRIVEVVKVEDDRFAPPPWQPVAWQSADSLLPPPAKKPPAPRPLAPVPEVEVEEAEAVPLFMVPGALATPETRPPGNVADEDDDPISIDEEPEPEAEEWEWKMALARARATAEKEKKDKARVAAGPAPATTSSFRTRTLPLAAPTTRTTRVVDSPKPMAKIARPEPRKTAPIEARKPAEPRAPIARVEPRSTTAQPQAARPPRTAPPMAPPPGRKSAQRPAEPAPVAESKAPARASLEKSVSRVFSPPAAAAGKPRPLPRLARGTGSPDPRGQPTRPQLALGSTRLPAMRDPSQDVTATDITAVDRAEASMRDEEDTRVNVVVPPSADITLDGLDPDAEVENTMVDGKPNGVAIVSVDGGSPLPRLTARLRRQSVPN